MGNGYYSEEEKAKRETVLSDLFPKQTEFLEAVFSGNYDRVLYGGAIRGGKMLPLDTPIPTPDGWSTMGKLKVGDDVICANGNICQVTHLSDIENNPDAWELFFDDGSSIVCDSEHQWLTTTRKDRLKIFSKSNDTPYFRGSKKNTREIVETIKDGRYYNHAIVNCSPVDLPKIVIDEDPIPIGPYTLGMLISDDRSPIKGEEWVDIPIKYRRGAIWDRVALINGICDGGMGFLKNNGSIEINGESLLVRDGIMEILYSLGVNPKCRNLSYKWLIQFWADFPCFSKDGKSERQKMPKGNSHKYRTIISAKKSAPVPMRCISVNSDTHTYLCGRNFLPTHNTMAGLTTLIILCRLFPKSRWAVVRDSMSRIKSTTKPSFDKMKPTNFIQNENAETMTCTFKNGSQIVFMGENYADDKELNKFKGFEINGALLEEVNELQEITYEKIVERSGTYIPPIGFEKAPVIIMMTCNPTKNWVKRRFYDKWKDGTLNVRTLYIQSKITDNPYAMADASYLRSLEEMSEFNRRVFVDGDWEFEEKTGAEFYKGFAHDRNVRNLVNEGTNSAYDPERALHISFDENVHPYLPCGVFQIEGSDAYMIKEFAGRHPENTLSSVCGLIRREYKGHFAGMYIYGDATSKKADTKQEQGRNFFTIAMEELSIFRPQLRVLSRNPNILSRKEWMNAMFEKKLPVTLTIDRGCSYTINDLQMLKESASGEKHKNVKTDPKTKIQYQELGHFSDLMEYFMCSAFMDEYNRNQKKGIGRDTRFIKPISKHVSGYK